MHRRQASASDAAARLLHACFTCGRSRDLPFWEGREAASAESRRRSGGPWGATAHPAGAAAACSGGWLRPLVPAPRASHACAAPAAHMGRPHGTLPQRLCLADPMRPCRLQQIAAQTARHRLLQSVSDERCAVRRERGEAARWAEADAARCCCCRGARAVASRRAQTCAGAARGTAAARQASEMPPSVFASGTWGMVSLAE